MKEYSFFNSGFIPSEELPGGLGEACVPGLFETMRCRQGGIVYLDRHLERLEGSSRKIKIDPLFSRREIKLLIARLVQMNNYPDTLVRVSLWDNGSKSNLLISAKRYHSLAAGKYACGFSCAISRFRQQESSIFAGIKTTSRILYELSYREAKDKGFDEALIFNSRGYLAEASRSNIFFVKEKILFTPELSCGCLEGVTRKAVLDLAKRAGIPFQEGKFVIADLLAADEAFLTNSLIGVMALSRVENNLVGRKKSGGLYGYFTKKYAGLKRYGI
ncbi:MAG: aminotransferase class IV [Candidatus Omnitrophica bacterium]|nr:aminotransferase class IV [Candidatus Omnitrophota bacterium]MDD5512176.1 aminotransferase class IV [Candidatus Omnitrophota bacterium]